MGTINSIALQYYFNLFHKHIYVYALLSLELTSMVLIGLIIPMMCDYTEQRED